jgi:hypothetical protein
VAGPLINGFNQHLITGLPHLSFVPRNPEPLGVANKMLADALSKIILFIEPCEGKERMRTKKFEDTCGHTTATTLRAAVKWQGSGRVIRATRGSARW